MRVLIFERNLLWSSKLQRSLSALGHQPTVTTNVPKVAGEAEVAIVNLSDPGVEAVIGALHEVGVKVIAHAGHKDKELLAVGASSGADRVVTNGELSFKVGEIIATLVA